MRLPRLIALALLPALAAAQTVNVSVDATQIIRTVDERIFGANAVIWDQHAATEQTITMLQAAGLRAVRVPGGSLSDEYHWRVNRTLANTWTWASHFGSFTKVITALNAQTVATVNYGTGTPEEAAAWVAYANASPTTTANTLNVVIGPDAKGYDWKTAAVWANLREAAPLAVDDGMNFLRLGRAAAVGVKYWEIGNECYGTWETDEQAVRHDPYTYAVRAKDYIAKMKAVDPTIKIGVVAVTGETSYANNTAHPATNPRTGAVRNGWTPVMLTTLKAQGVTPDFIIYHRYDQAPGQESDAALLQSARTWPDDVADLRQQLNDYLGTAAAGVEILVTENNSVYTDPGKQSTSVVNGLFLADSIGHLLQTEVNALLWWDIRNGTPTSNGQIVGNQSASLYGWRNYGDYGMISTPLAGAATDAYTGYPTYYVMKLLAHFARGGDAVVKATSSSNLLTVFAAKRADGSLTLLVLNKDPANTLTASIALTGFAAPATANRYAYGIAQDNAAKPGGSGAVDIETLQTAVSGTPFSASFAPYSATVIALGGGAPVPPPPPTPPTPPPPTTPSTPAPTPGSGGGGGGGGGAPSLWFGGALILLGVAHRWRCAVRT